MQEFIATSFAFSFLLGVAWGLANIGCLARITRLVIGGGRVWALAGWVVVKLFGLYALAGWLLIGVRVPALAWLAGFTVSLIAFAVKSFPSVRTLLKQSTLPLLFLSFTLMTRLAGASEAAHGAEAAAPAHPPEIPNLITLVTHFMPDGPAVHFLHTWENAIFAVVIVLLVGVLFSLAARRLAMRPGRGQTFAEMVITGLENLVCGVLGQKHGRKYLPFLGTLFIFILAMNLAGLVPGLKSPTSRFEMTFSLALCVFFCVQWTAVKSYGFFGYIYHLMNEPKDPVGWALAPLMFFIELVGEIVKPVSLSLRLFGNIMGEDTLLGVFVMLGALMMAWSHLPIGVPLHLPFVLLAIIFSTVQALVFTSLSMIYIYTKLPHEEHAGH